MPRARPPEWRRAPLDRRRGPPPCGWRRRRADLAGLRTALPIRSARSSAIASLRRRERGKREQWGTHRGQLDRPGHRSWVCRAPLPNGGECGAEVPAPEPGEGCQCVGSADHECACRVVLAVPATAAVVGYARARSRAAVRRNGMEGVGETGKCFGLDLQVFRLRRADLDPTAPATLSPPHPTAE